MQKFPVFSLSTGKFGRDGFAPDCPLRHYLQDATSPAATPDHGTARFTRFPATGREPCAPSEARNRAASRLSSPVFSEGCALNPGIPVLRTRIESIGYAHMAAHRFGFPRLGGRNLASNQGLVKGHIPPLYPQASRKNGAGHPVRALFLDCALKSGPA